MLTEFGFWKISNILCDEINEMRTEMNNLKSKTLGFFNIKGRSPERSMINRRDIRAMKNN